MKIVERGEPPIEWPLRRKCPRCMSVLEVDADDIEMPTISGEQGWFICPVCHDLVHVGEYATRAADARQREIFERDYPGKT